MNKFREDAEKGDAMRFLRVFIAAAILAICGASCGGNSPVGPEPVTHASYPDAAPSPSPSPSPAS